MLLIARLWVVYQNTMYKYPRYVYVFFLVFVTLCQWTSLIGFQLTSTLSDSDNEICALHHSQLWPFALFAIGDTVTNVVIMYSFVKVK